jgi:hypothetical protein
MRSVRYEPSLAELGPPLSSRGPLGASPLHHHRRRASPPLTLRHRQSTSHRPTCFHGQPTLGHLTRRRAVPRRCMDPPELAPPSSIAGKPPPATTRHFPPPPSTLCLGRNKRKADTSSLFLCVSESGPDGIVGPACRLSGDKSGVCNRVHLACYGYDWFSCFLFRILLNL